MTRSVAEIESFITMLRVACEDAKVNALLERILDLPSDRRRAFIHTWVSDLLIQQAPNDFIEAIACLADDAIARKAREVIHPFMRPGQ